MSLNTLLSLLRPQPGRFRSWPLRFLVLHWRLTRRFILRIATRAALFGGWIWCAAASLVGLETFEIIVGTFALAPELLPLVILGLALAWYFRERVRRTSRRARALWRRRRMKQGAKSTV